MHHQPAVRQPQVNVPPPVQKPDLRSHLAGVWEMPGKNGAAAKQMIFTSDGGLTFRGGFEYYNPANWKLDENREELVIAFPSAPNEKLDIFHMYVGDGVQAFNRSQKEVTYHFDADTWSLNLAGWSYSKADKTDSGPFSRTRL